MNTVHNPNPQIMDNEACDLLKMILFKKNISYQLVHPNTHL